MHRSFSASALLAAAVCLGCGQQPANSPAPPDSAVGAPAADRAPPTGGELGQQSPASQDESRLSEEMPVEEKAAMTDEAGDDEKPFAEAARPEEAADDPIDKNDAKPAAAKSKGSSGNLLRGLGNSLGRALSKAVTGAGDDARPAPKLDADPFPDGEPKR